MNRPPPFLRRGLRALVAGAFSLVLWTLWLGLALVLAVQVYIAFAQELAVPGFVLRRIERDLAETGVRATFGRTSFDPTGRVLIENVRLALPEFPDPIVEVRAVYLQLNPWVLAVGRFEPREIRLSGVNASVPAMLSPSGRAEEMVRELEATLVPTGQELAITHLSARVAGVALSARGAVSLPRREPAGGPRSLAELVSTQFPKLCRQAMVIKEQLDGLEEPALALELVPSDTRTAVVNATLFARSFNLENPLTAHIRGLRIVTRLPLIGDAPATSRLELTADELRLPFEANARGVRATLVGRFLPGGYRFEPRELQLIADQVDSSGFTASALSAQLFPQPLPRLEADVVAQIMGAPMAVRASANFAERSATLRFAGAVSPQVLTPLSTHLRTQVRKYFDFTALDCVDGEARLGPGWQFQKLTARVAVRGINAYEVPMEEGRATLELEPHRFYSPDAYARIGDNFARGTYEQDLQTRQYRFLLQGRLRPLDISGWFHEWWPNFFRQLAFPAAAPVASVDVGGFWREGWRSTVFVAADAAQPVIRGAAFDRVRTRLFIRPAFFDGLDLAATRGPGTAQGTFTYRVNPETHDWRTLELNLASTIDPALAVTIIGPAAGQVLAQFKFSHPPDLKLKGRLDGADAPGGAHQALEIQARTDGEFRFHEFPLQGVSFNATLHDGEIAVDNVLARFAGGSASGSAKVWGPPQDRRVGFNFTLRDASLGQAAGALQRYVAELNHRTPAPPGKFVQEKANVVIDLSATAEGRYADPLSFQGEGAATLRGEEIGEVPLLGMLSGLLKFTALRFTSAKSNFKINGAKLEFSEVTLRGANSAIDAHGDYALDRKELDFKAKIFPFQESGNLIKTVVGAVLSPISNVFEVKLTGSLEKPEWAFVIGPTNLLRSLASDNADANKPGEAGPETAPKSDPSPSPAAPPASQAPSIPEESAPPPSIDHPVR